MAADSAPGTRGATQQDFVETPYEDASWPVVGEVQDTGEFLPMEIENIGKSTARVVDPMFADYGGFTSTGEQKRWHLPEHLSASIREEAVEEEDTEDRVALTEQEIAAIKAEAFEKGKKEGFAQSEQAQQQRFAQMDKKVSAVLTDMGAQLREQIAVTEQSAVQLALAISKKIVGYAVEINPEYIAPLVTEALGLAGGAAVRKVRVSPEDMEFIQIVGIGKHLKAFDGSWQFEKDDSIRSGCIVETSAGEIDFQLDAAWDRIKENVVKSLA